MNVSNGIENYETRQDYFYEREKQSHEDKICSCFDKKIKVKCLFKNKENKK